LEQYSLLKRGADHSRDFHSADYVPDDNDATDDETQSESNDD